MQKRLASTGLTLLLTALGCSSSSSKTAADAVDASPLACRLGESSDLPGVGIHILRDDCTFTLAEARAGISIPYQISIADEVDQVVVKTTGRSCYQPGPSGLLVLESLSGGDNQYCLCDLGPPNPSDCQQPLHAGTYSATFDWDGRNWFGPSDTNNPKGDYFPAGAYRLVINAQGSGGSIDGGATTFSVNATFGINLTK